MSYKTIVCYTDSLEAVEEVVTVSCMLAEQYDAHLTGLYVTPPPPIYATAEIATPAMLVNYHDQYHHELSDKIEEVFIALTESRGGTAEWRRVDAVSSVSATVAELGHTADLVVVSGALTDSTNGFADDRLSRIISASRRPTMVIPTDVVIDAIGKHIMVGWDGSDESTRAVFDALPLLKTAGRVDLLRINPAGSERHHTFGTQSELVNTLARHGVKANLSFSACAVGEVASELLRTAFEQGADLLVTGAYGHSRMHDLLMGSVTRKILADAKLPVLMAH
jgi:nucleotide-binding universal stress UspA family protein